MKNHENQPGTMKNQPGAMKNHENRSGTMKNHKNPTGTMKNHENQPGTMKYQPGTMKNCSAYELRRRQSGSARECTGYADDLRPIHVHSTCSVHDLFTS